MTSNPQLLSFNPRLQPATLILRYKRFLADIVTPAGERLTIHCANTGAMTGCATPGDTVWYSTSDNPKRKYPHSWELTHTQSGDWICVNTLRANELVSSAIDKNHIVELSGYTSVKREIKYGDENSRIDLLLQAENRSNCYIEVKSVTLLQQQCGYFPDAVTLRGQKHLRELQSMVAGGHRAVLFLPYCIRASGKSLRPDTLTIAMQNCWPRLSKQEWRLFATVFNYRLTVLRWTPAYRYYWPKRSHQQALNKEAIIGESCSPNTPSFTPLSSRRQE